MTSSVFRLLLVITAVHIGTSILQDIDDNQWTASSSPPASWNGIATSSSGEFIAAAACLGGSIYQSSDYGQTWSETTSAPSSGYNWFAITSDSTGSQIVAVSSDAGGVGGMYLSSDLGVTWSQTSVPSNLAWTSVSSSSSGQYVMATSSGATGGAGSIYVSKDNGASWNEALTGSLNFNSIAVSSSGKNAVVVAAQG